MAEGESLFPSHQQLPTQNGASALSALGAGSLHSCRPRRLLSQGVLFLQLSISHGLRLSFSSPESSETIIHCSAGFNCWANDPPAWQDILPINRHLSQAAIIVTHQLQEARQPLLQPVCIPGSARSHLATSLGQERQPWLSHFPSLGTTAKGMSQPTWRPALF